MSESYTAGPSMNGIQRGEPTGASEARKALAANILKEVKADAAHWKPAFTRMKADEAFVRTQLPNERPEGEDRAKVNITQRHVNQRLASLYAKNPTFVAERRQRLDFEVWDGSRSSLEQASMAMQSGMMDPNTMALLADVQQAITRQRMLDNVGKTMQILLQYAIDEQQPPFKPQCKQTVRRAIVAGVGYAKLHFQRRMTKRPEAEAKLADITSRLALIERLASDIEDNVIQDANAKEVEELRLAQEALQNDPDIVVREGLVLDFPRPRFIIPDRDCVQLAVGFPGARRVSEMFILSLDEVKEIYAVDLGSGYTAYRPDGVTLHSSSSQEDMKVCIYETYDRRTGLKYVTCDGHADFLVDPVPPPLHYIEPFFPFFPLTFNPIEDEKDIYPDSDVRLLMPIQREINRKREAVRQHRIANRPLNVARKGVLTEADAKNLSDHAAHDVIELEGLSEGEDVVKAFAPFPKPGLDPNLYETGTDLTDVQLVVGAQEANLGGTSGDSATENSIAETSRMQSVDSNIDDIDDWFTALARAAGQVLLREMQLETVKAVVGPGAVWPEFKAQDIAEEVFLKIQAGSSGRPNKAQDLANIERATPLLVQLPGVSPEWLAKLVLRTLDAHIDLEEAYTSGLPSITAANRQMQASTGDPATDPNAQGGQGGDNQEAAPAGRGGAQPAYSAQPGGAQGGDPGMS